MFRNMFMYSAVASTGLLCSNALADIPGGDAHLTMQGGQLVTGRISEDGLTITPNVRVFFTDLGEDVPNTADDPGLRADVGAFPAGTSISLGINRALRMWNGTDFSTIAPITMTTTFGPVSVTSPLTDVFTPGFSIPVDPDGSFHHHPDRTLNDPASDGIYLLDLTIGASGLGNAPPIWTLYNQNMDDATAQAAYDYAVATIPSPVAAIPLLSGLVMLPRRRR